MSNRLELKNLSIEIDDKIILNKINLVAKSGDLIALIGPNGAGKSTLLKALMHHFKTRITQGSVLFNKKNINNLATYEIARNGFFYIDQTPLELVGVPMVEFLKDVIRIHHPNASLLEQYKNIDALFDDLSLDKSLLSHDVNVGFSGGQKKKSEIIQSQLLDAKVLLLDEIDAGLDVDAIKKIQGYLKITRPNHITIMVSHDLDIFNTLKPNKVVVLANHTIAKTGGIELINDIKKNGYKKYEQAKEQIHDAYKF